MKKYIGNKTNHKRTIVQELQTSKVEKIYVSDHFFILETNEQFKFFYNPQFLWKRLDKTEVHSSIIDYWKNNFVTFENFELTEDINQNLEKFYELDIPHKNVDIGNFYFNENENIITTDNTFIFTDKSGKTTSKSIKEITRADLLKMFSMATETLTPNFIREIYSSDAFMANKHKLNSKTIIGAVIGDIIGSTYEFVNNKNYDFDFFPKRSRFTDDTVLTMAITDALVNNKDYTLTAHSYARKYKGRGYGGKFRDWIKSDVPQPYNSLGNGSAMRVSPVGFAFNDIETVMQKAKETAEITHNHPEGIKGAQAIASAIYLARTGKSKQEIKSFIEETFQYDLNFTLDEIRADYKLNVTCMGSVPHAINAFLESTDYETTIRLSISIGGDSDTIACMAGGIAVAFYKNIPQKILDFAHRILPNEFIQLLNDFDQKYDYTR